MKKVQDKHEEASEPVDQYKNELDEPKKFEDYEVEGAANHLMNAEEVKSNAGLHKAAVAHMKKKLGHMQKITSLDQLKSVAKEKIAAADKEKKGSY